MEAEFFELFAHFQAGDTKPFGGLGEVALGAADGLGVELGFEVGHPPKKTVIVVRANSNSPVRPLAEPLTAVHGNLMADDLSCRMFLDAVEPLEPHLAALLLSDSPSGPASSGNMPLAHNRTSLRLCGESETRNSVY